MVAGAGLLAFVGVGIGFYGQTVLLDALPAARGWSPSSVAGASSLYFVVSGLAGPAVGRAVDRFGVRGVMALGAVLMAAALVWVGRASSVVELYFSFAALSVGFSLIGSVPNNALVTRWFVTRRAQALSWSQTGVSLGGILLVPLAVALIARAGFEAATDLFALLVLVVALPTILLVVAWDPEDHGLQPDGDSPLDSRNPLLAAERQRQVWSAREILNTRAFWLLALAFGAALFSQMSFLIHQVALMREPLGGTLASFTVSITAGASIVGRFAGGWIADRVDKRRFGMVCFGVQALALVWIALASSPGALLAGAVLLGLTIGNVFMLQSLLTSELYGIPSFGTAFGMLLLITQIAGGLGPLGLAVLARAGGYGSGLLVMSVFAASALVVLGFVHPPARPPQGRMV